MGAGCAADLEQEEMIFGAALDMEVNIDNLKTDIDTLQSDWISTHDRYKYIPRTTDVDIGLDYSVTEYVNSRGEKGYQIIYYDKLGRIATSTGTGVEAASRTYVVDFPIIIPTST